MSGILGYARVSTGDQDVAGQTMRLERAGAIKTFGSGERPCTGRWRWQASAAPRERLFDHNVEHTGRPLLIADRERTMEYQERVEGRTLVTMEMLSRLQLLAFGAVLVSTTAHARFLQVDPVGYADQNNLYEYVGDDPINGRDPTGLTCAQSGPNGAGVCTIDKVLDTNKDGKLVSRDATKADHQKYANVEKSLTTAYNKALSSGKTEHVSVENGNVKYSFSVSAHHVAESLAQRTMTAYPLYRGAMATSDFNTTYIGQRGINPGTTRYGGPDRTREVEFLHEGIHGTREERASGMISADLAPGGPLVNAHQDRYNAAASDILGPR